MDIAGPDIDAFIERWRAAGANERANFQPFAAELCDILGVERPNVRTPDPEFDDYGFEYPVTFAAPDGSTTQGRIDLYKRGCFVLEAKQGADAELAQLPLFGGSGRRRSSGIGDRGTEAWALAMQRAKGQAERYAKALPVDHGWPPVLVVVDIGHVIELYADFSKTGKAYAHFPDTQSFRIPLERLAEPAIRERLATIWTDPMALDPAAHAERVTKDVSQKLAVIARALEQAGHSPDSVAGFLMRCMFSMFAEDVGLLPKDCFSDLLKGLRDHDASPQQTAAALQRLWLDMDKGAEWSSDAHGPVLWFNGGLFEGAHAIPIEPHHRSLLIEAADADWRDVEPAIFGTFLEQALDKRERRKLGAEFTPRRWVERLIMPAAVEPLRERWTTVKTEVLTLDLRGEHKKAVTAVKAFHEELCSLRILDPACGSGNFLYVTWST